MRTFQTAQGLGPDGMMDRGGETEAALRNAAKRLQSMGRNGDTLLAHITPAEARLLDAVTDGGSVNPTTGLLEFWGRIGGSKHSREQRAEADNHAASPSGNAQNNTQNDGGGSRPRTYTDSQLAGATRANEEAARTRETVRSYLSRNGASAADSAITRADAHALQQADASQPAEPAQAREQGTNAPAQQARRSAATTLNESLSAGLLTQKSIPAPSANRYTAAAPAPTSAKPANAAAATAETATTATATTPMAPGADPRLSPSATPAQQARNITQARRFIEQQRAAEANANAVAARTRQTVKDYLGLMAQTPASPNQTPAKARKAVWGAVTERYKGGLLANPAQTNDLQIPVNKIAWYNSQPALKKGWGELNTILKANPYLSLQEQIAFQEIFGQEGGMALNKEGTAVAGILAGTLSSLINGKYITTIASGTSPSDLAVKQIPDVFQGYFNEVFKAQNGSRTLSHITDLDAAAVFGDSLFSHGTYVGTTAIQKGINTVKPGTLGEPDGIPGSKTVDAYNALTSNPKTKDALLNAIADARWEHVQKSAKIPGKDKPGWKNRIDYYRP